MKGRLPLVAYLFFPLFALVSVVHAADETLGEQFLGSPLLALVAMMIIAVLASVYHRIRK